MGETARKVDRGRDKIRGRWEREREGGRETEEGERESAVGSEHGGAVSRFCYGITTATNFLLNRSG